MALVCESSTTALLGEAALFIPDYEWHSPYATSDFDTALYRVTALWGDPYCTETKKITAAVQPLNFWCVLFFFRGAVSVWRSRETPS